PAARRPPAQPRELGRRQPRQPAPDPGRLPGRRIAQPGRRARGPGPLRRTGRPQAGPRSPRRTHRAPRPQPEQELMSLLATRRLLRILRVVIRYRLDDLLLTLPLPAWMRALRLALPWRWLPRRKLEL